VQSVVLDDLLSGLERLDLVKIDIEGAEPRALEGMRTLVSTHRPVILTELFPGAIRRVSRLAPESYLDQLRSLGYDLFLNDDSETRGSPLDNAAILGHPDLEAHMLLDLIAKPKGR
jgi:hypothetical protein